jgi:cephalosporin-C deacetylase-like acetyl esterase
MRRNVRNSTAVAAVVLSAFFGLAHAQAADALVVTPSNATGIWNTGDKVGWQIQWHGDEPAGEVRYVIKRGGRTEVGRGTVTIVDGAGELHASFDTPAAYLTKFTTSAADGKQHQALGGALISLDEIEPSAPRPDDFDAFWDAKLAELAAVPMNPQLEPADSGKPGVDFWKITLDNVGGRRIRGQLARPTTENGNRLPALLIPQWAGVYPLEKAWAVDRAAEGWLVLNILAHDLPIDAPPSFYEQQYAGPLQNYWAIGNDDRDASYYLPMYLSCYRAAEYLAQRPDWNGETLVVCGTSQGGQQTLVAAAIHPRVTAALALVPAGCDMLGPAVGRTGGWPQWYDQLHGKDPARVREASRYYDVANFAPRIKCPLLVGVGLIDQVCPPEGVIAALNQADAAKEVVVLPTSGHQDVDGSQRAYYDRCYGVWLPALREGRPTPVNQP